MLLCMLTPHGAGRWMRASIATSDLCDFLRFCAETQMSKLTVWPGGGDGGMKRASLSVSHTHSGCALCANVLSSQPIKISF